MNAETSRREESGGNHPLVDDLRLRLHGAQTQERAARAEARRLMRELAIARRLLQFFVAGPPPTPAVAAAALRPVPATLLTGTVRFHLDACQSGGANTVISGWAFCPIAAWDGKQATVTLEFRHGATAYAVTTVRTARPDVATFFSTQGPEATGGARGLEGTGFSCEILHESLPADVDLEIVLRLECAGNVCERFTGQRLRL